MNHARRLEKYLFISVKPKLASLVPQPKSYLMKIKPVMTAVMVHF